MSDRTYDYWGLVNSTIYLLPRFPKLSLFVKYLPPGTKLQGS